MTYIETVVLNQQMNNKRMLGYNNKNVGYNFKEGLTKLLMTFVKVHATGIVNTQSKVKCRNAIIITYVTHVPLLFNQDTFASLSLKQFIPY